MAEPFSILELRRQSAAHGRRGHRWRFVALILAVLFLLFNLFVYLIASGIVRHQLEWRLATALHRPVFVQKVRLNPYTLSATIDGLGVTDHDGQPLCSCERLYVNFQGWSLFSGKLIFKEISLTAPTARLVIEKTGALNISDLLASPPAPAGTPPSKPRALVIRELTIVQARFAFADHSHAQDFATELGPLSFSLKDFSTAPAAPGAPYEFTASTEFGETLHWRGTFSAEPLRSAGDFSLGKIALGKYAPYYAAAVRADLLAGTLDAAGHYELDLGTEPRVMRLDGGELHLHDLQIAPRGSPAPVIVLPAIDLTGLNASLTPLKAAAAKLVVTGGRIAAQRAADGAINLADLLPPAGSGAPAAPAAAAALPDISLADLELRHLALSFDDAAGSRPVHLDIPSLELAAQNFSLAAGAAPAPFKLGVRFAPQGGLDLAGTVGAAQRRADFTVDLSDFALSGLSPYLDPFVNLRVAQGAASARGQLAIAAPAGETPQIAFRGDAELDRVATVDGTAGDDFASFASLGFKQVDFTSAPLTVSVAQISLIEPTLHFTIHRDGSTNLAAVLRKETPVRPSAPPQASPSADTTAPTRKITVGRVALSEGAVQVTDRSITPSTHLSVNQIAGFVADLSSDESARSAVDLRAKLNNDAPFTIQGEINPIAREIFVDSTANLAGADLQPMGPYFAKYAGYVLTQGSLTLDLKVRLAQDRLDSQNTITLDRFDLGAKTDSPSTTGLPVRFAIALLKDNHGRIVINLPVQGSLSDPNFDVGQIAAQVFTNLLTKAATAPFALLGAMFGGSEQQQLDRIDFAAGSSALAPAEMKKLEVLVRALMARPGLRLELAGSADRDADAPALQKQKLQEFIRTKIWESRRQEDPSLTSADQVKLTPEESNRVLIGLYVATFRLAPNVPTPGAVPPAPASQTSAAAREAASTASPAPPPHTLFGRILRYVFGESGGGKTAAVPLVHGKPESATLPATGGPGVPPSTPAYKLPPPAEMEAQLAAQVPVEDADLHQLAVDRAQQVKDYLVAQGVPEARLSLAGQDAPAGHQVVLHLQ